MSDHDTPRPDQGATLRDDCAAPENQTVARHGLLTYSTNTGATTFVVARKSTPKDAAGGPEPTLHTVTATVCSACLDGAGGECHTPGCTLRQLLREIGSVDGVTERMPDIDCDVCGDPVAPGDVVPIYRAAAIVTPDNLTDWATVGRLAELWGVPARLVSATFDHVGLNKSTDHARGDGDEKSWSPAAIEIVRRELRSRGRIPS